MLRRSRETLALIADLVAVGGAVATAVGFALAAAIGVIGYITNTPWFYILVFSPMGAAGALWLFDQIWKPRSADELAWQWKHHDSYLVWVAACLWVGVRPSPTINEKHEAYPMLQRIKAALVADQIDSLHGDTGMTARVARQELIKLAERLKQRPRFLYPFG